MCTQKFTYPMVYMKSSIHDYRVLNVELRPLTYLGLDIQDKMTFSDNILK